MEYLPLAVLGGIISLLGCLNIKGNIRSIHWYNRRKVMEQDIPKYGKAVGCGTLIIGVSCIITAVLQMLFSREAFYYITVIGCVIGLGFILYGQLKYNHGIF